MKLLYIIGLSFMLAACELQGVDQCMRVELFNSCLSNIPKGPESTHYNDWAEVVSQCNVVSTNQSYRQKEFIPKGCR